jgi:DNA polymerase-3 subunit gamma/tau
MTQALYRKWRPREWDEVIGQQHILQTLTNAVRADRVGHAYLFAGPRGTGKTTVARIIAKAVNCLEEDLAKRPCNECEHCKAVNENRFLDLIEIDAASNTSVDDVRDLRDKINFAPSQGKYKIYIIDEVHMLSTAAFNALLKTLEEPPPHAIFVLATTEIHKIPATVLSRCQRHEFRRVPVDAIIDHLKRIAEQEKIKVDDEALSVIARQATGSVRDAISLLDQLASTGEAIDLALTQRVLGTATSQTVLDLIASVRDRQPALAMDAIHQALDSGADPRSLARQVVDYLRGLLLIQMGNDDQVEVTKEIKSTMAEHAGAFSTHNVLRMMKAFNTAATDTRGGWQPSLSLELAVAEVLETPADAPELKQERKPVKAEAAESTAKKTGPEKKAPKSAEPKAKTKAPAKEAKKEAQDKPKAQKSEAASKSASNDSKSQKKTRVPKKGEEVVTLAEVVKAWRDIRSVIKPDHPGIEALLNSCKPLEVRGDELHLGFQSDTVRALMDMPEKIKIARNAIKEVLDVDLSIKCVVTSAKGKLPPDVNPDGMVATALQNGGEIVDVQE